MDNFLSALCLFLTVLQLSNGQANLAAAILGLGGFGEPPDTPSTGSGSCPYQAHPDRRKFSQVVNNRVMTQECAPGTMFVLSKCSCDNIPAGGMGGGPMPGSNPRLESILGAGGNPLINALMAQFGGPPTPTSRAPPPTRNLSPMNTNKLNMIRRRVTSGVRPDQNSGSMPLNVRKEPQTPQGSIQYNPKPSTSQSSGVDPSMLPSVLPAEILRALQNSNHFQKPNSPRPTAGSKPRNPQRNLPSDVQRMVERASKPVQTRSKSPPKQSMEANLPPEVLAMLKKSMQPPETRGKDTRKVTQKPKQTARNTRKQIPTARAPAPRQAPTREPSSNRNQLQDMMAQLMGARDSSSQSSGRSSLNQQNGPRQDPLAALLGNIQAPPPVPSRTPPRIPSSSNNRGSSGGDPFAALLSGFGGSSSSSNPFASMLAGMGGSDMPASPLGGGGGNLAALLGGMGGSSSGSSSSLDIAALSGAMNPSAMLANPSGRTVDLTSVFNSQGLMGIGGGLAGLNNLNMVKLQELDRQGVIDLSDLTPAGLAAANAHFAG